MIVRYGDPAKRWFNLTVDGHLAQLRQGTRAARFKFATRVAHELARWAHNGLLRPDKDVREYYSYVILNDAELLHLATVHGVAWEHRTHFMNATRTRLVEIMEGKHDRRKSNETRVEG